jgi:hypothetical protein
MLNKRDKDDYEIQDNGFHLCSLDIYKCNSLLNSSNNISRDPGPHNRLDGNYEYPHFRCLRTGLECYHLALAKCSLSRNTAHHYIRHPDITESFGFYRYPRNRDRSDQSFRVVNFCCRFFFADRIRVINFHRYEQKNMTPHLWGLIFIKLNELSNL